MLLARHAAAAFILMGAGCVPLTDYRKLEDRYKEQEAYIQKHKDEIGEFQKREQLLTLQMKELQKDNELCRARLQKSEALRAQEAARGGKFIATEQPASSPKESDTTFAGFHVNTETGGIVLEHDVLFSSGKHEIKSSGKKILDELVAKLNSGEYSKYCIRVDGHTDDAPVVKTVKENHDNWELGFKRAKAVLDYMVAKGISQERCFIASFNCFRPICGAVIPVRKAKKSEKADTGARAQNRRVEVVLFEKR
jgi:outer membrane protein OmpA-like peptidoglycan-associated protein